MFDNPSVLCLLYFVSSLIWREHLPHLLSWKTNICRILYNHKIKVIKIIAINIWKSVKPSTFHELIQFTNYFLIVLTSYMCLSKIDDYITFVHIRIKFPQSTITKSVFLYQIKFSENKYWSNKGDIYLDNMPSNYCHHWYKTSKRRKRKINKTKTPSPHQAKTALKYVALVLVSSNENRVQVGRVSFSASQKNLGNWKNNFNLGSSEENSDS